MYLFRAVIELIELRGSGLQQLLLDGESLHDETFESAGKNCQHLESLEVSFAVLLTDKTLISIKVF